MRRGLKTQDESKARELVNQLNELLSDEFYWKPSAREAALRKFNRDIVAAFYDHLEAEPEDSWASREEAIPLPGTQEGYSRVLLVGATGAGKTTLLRQLIGSDPVNDRFPSTSTAKTTVFDIEVIVRSDLYKCAVSFISRERVRVLIEECVIAAIQAHAERQPEPTVLRRLLEHTEQRFRLSYLLGTLSSSASSDEEEDLEPEGQGRGDTSASVVDVSDSERRLMEQRLRFIFEEVKRLSESKLQILVQGSGIAGSDESERDELWDDRLNAISLDDEVQLLVDSMLDDVEDKFSLLTEGRYKRDNSGWPVSWFYETTDRTSFIRTVNWFSSNYAPSFGKLLAPVTQGLRVSGPFRPSWEPPDSSLHKCVYIDGEGLGHAPATTVSLPTSVTQRYNSVDTILLIDNATQPMQAASRAVVHSVVSSGHDIKLALAFTHFDEVKGDNLPDAHAKRNHLWASLDNVLADIEKTTSVNAGRRLRQHLNARVFFLSRINEVLPHQARATLKSLETLSRLFETSVEHELEIGAVPVYDVSNLVILIQQATKEFMDYWSARMGLAFKMGVPKEHWTRIKALSRRYANLWEDQYGDLRPVADLIRLLSERLAFLISNPKAWKPYRPSQEECDAAISRVSREFYKRLHELVRERLFLEHLKDWTDAYSYKGVGSTDLRARSIRSIYEAAAPIPGETVESKTDTFVSAMRTLFAESATSGGAELIGNNLPQIQSEDHSISADPDLSQDGLIPLIVRIIGDNGGSALKQMVDKSIWDKFKVRFSTPWFQGPVSHGVPRWQHNIAWAKERAKLKYGLIKSSHESGRGQWELTEKGMQYYRSDCPSDLHPYL